MELISFVKGKVSDSKIKEFIEGYESFKRIDKPKGLITSYLLEDLDIKGLFIIEIIWESPETYENRGSDDAIQAIFKKVGSKPVIGKYEVIDITTF
jgi:heme-degrading monooxygenase HmoA